MEYIEIDGRVLMLVNVEEAKALWLFKKLSMGESKEDSMAYFSKQEGLKWKYSYRPLKRFTPYEFEELLDQKYLVSLV